MIGCWVKVLKGGLGMENEMIYESGMSFGEKECSMWG